LLDRFLFACFALVVLGCGPDDSAGDDSNDGGTGGTSGSGGSAGSAGSAVTGGTGGAAGSSATGGSGGMEPVCNMLELGDAPAVGFTYDLGDAPAPLGGDIADGTYVLTAFVVYGIDLGITDPFARVKVEISGGTWEFVESGPDEVDTPRTDTYTSSISGTQVTMTRSCPVVDMETATFTAGPDELTLYVLDRGTTIADVFTKQ